MGKSLIRSKGSLIQLRVHILAQRQHNVNRWSKISAKSEKSIFLAFPLLLGVYITLTITLNMGLPVKMSGQPSLGDAWFSRYWDLGNFGSLGVKKWAEQTGKYPTRANMDFFHHRSIFRNFLAGVHLNLTKKLS